MLYILKYKFMAHYCVQVVGYYNARAVSLSTGEASSLFVL